MQQTAKGFSLIELLIVVAIIAIVTTVATSSYRNYMMRTNRTDGASLLLRVAAAQERYYLNENAYAGPDDVTDLGFESLTSERGYYALTIEPADPGGLVVGYSATVRPIDGRGQQSDADCMILSINERGFRGSNPEPINVCWR
ncbi:MAG: type IV pilin protein [Gammaproteobacteria bacterium]|nr:MAG: type IV pilin protein [Gammaproteobacteria bacterium]